MVNTTQESEKKLQHSPVIYLYCDRAFAFLIYLCKNQASKSQGFDLSTYFPT